MFQLRKLWVPAVMAVGGLMTSPLAAAPHGGHGGGHGGGGHGGGGHGGGGHAVHVASRGGGVSHGAAHAGLAHVAGPRGGVSRGGAAFRGGERGFSRGEFRRGEVGRDRGEFGRGGNGRGGHGYGGYGGYGDGYGGYYGDGWYPGYFLGGLLGSWYPGYFGGGGAYWDDDGYTSSYDQPPAYYPTPPDYAAPAPAYGTAPSPVPANAAIIRVIVPDPNAQVWFEGQLMSGTGTDRYFQSPPLTPGQTYRYEIRASWNQGVRQVDQNRSVPVTAGQTSVLDFTRPSSAP